jgi:serine/threonine protein kinase
VAVYEALASLQGDVIPRLVGYGWILRGAVYYVATKLVEGVVLSRAVLGDAGEEAELKREAQESLKRIHGAGVAHKDIRAENLIVRPAGACGKRLVFLDFGFSETSASATEKAADVYALHAVLQSLKSGEWRPKRPFCITLTDPLKAEGLPWFTWFCMQPDVGARIALGVSFGVFNSLCLHNML